MNDYEKNDQGKESQAEKKSKVIDIEEVSMDESVINDLIEKYDAESRYRKLSGLQGKFISAWLV